MDPVRKFKIILFYSGYEYSSNGILVASKIGNEIQFEGGNQSSQRDTWVKFKADKPMEIYVFVQKKIYSFSR